MVPENVFGAPPAADYSSAGPFLFATINTSGQIATVGTAGAAAAGILDNAPSAAGMARMVFGGVRKIQAGSGGLALGDTVGSDANGKGVKDTTSGHYYMGICVKAAAAGAIAEIVWLSPTKI